MYYRIAIRREPTALWQWKSTVLTLNAVFPWLWLYRAEMHDRLSVFSSSSREEMDEQLARENQGQATTAITPSQFLQGNSGTTPSLSNKPLCCYWNRR